MFALTPYIIALPLAGFLFLGLFGYKLKNEKLIGIIGSGTIGLSFVIACVIFFSLLKLPPDERRLIVPLFTWITTATGTVTSLDVAFALQVDQLSILMTLIVTGVGFLIHVYSIGYMHSDPGFRRYFTYMNLFIFAMLNLVLADNFVLFFLGWEGVGLCSYLLIGFWYKKTFAETAARKAFIVNRIGDFGFMLGIFLIFKHFGSLNFISVFERAEVLHLDPSLMTWIALLLFVGAIGKSAQIPLYVWLPDAMAGPTPVSALIHAATMVTAGVYMVARCSMLYALAPTAMAIVAVVGVLTAVYAASIGLVQNDIKKVLAYSTISQLGYMFLAMGVASFSAGIFHVMTHAFFKALLFLGSGAVIHAMHEEQDIQNMGGLKKYLPITHKTFVIGSLAIAGIPPFAGFFSKDEILWSAFHSDYGSIVLWFLGIFGAAMTAFYMFRLVSLTFEGAPRWDHHNLHPHEAPKTMTVPLIILAFLSIVGGFFGVPQSLGWHSAVEHWLDPVFSPAQDRLRISPYEIEAAEYILMILSVAVAGSAIYFARNLYLQRNEIVENLTLRFSRFHKILFNKYYVDELYDKTIVNPLIGGSQKLLWKWVDVSIIDWLVNKSAEIVGVISGWSRKIQTGVAQFYALIFVVGVLCIFGYIIF